jgi:hypothetical protein
VNSKNRGSRHAVGGFRVKTTSGENPHDFFPTPMGVTRALIEACPLPDGLWCEPAVGDGHIINAVGPRELWATFDIRPVAPPELSSFHQQRDFLALPDDIRFHVIITNPPFSLAEEFVRKSLRHADYVVMLLRLAFLESRRREAFHAEHPSDVYVLSRRPSFMANGATDSCAYAWFVWGPGRGGRWTILPTPETRRDGSA